MFIVSFPRSGQHLLERILRGCYAKAGVPYSYCEHYGASKHRYDPKLSHSLECHGCRKIPCENGCLFQKNHDLWLKRKKGRVLNQNDGDKYLVLYRANPVKQMEAYFRYECDVPEVTQENYEKFQKFFSNNITYYRRFIDKWVCNKPNIHVIEYYNLLYNTNDVACCALEFLGVPTRGVAEAVAETPIIRRSFSEKYFNWLKDIET